MGPLQNFRFLIHMNVAQKVWLAKNIKRGLFPKPYMKRVNVGEVIEMGEV